MIACRPQNAPVDAEIQATAIHEAGHAVAHVRLQILQGSVSIEPMGQALGHVLAEGADSVWTREAAAGMVLAYCAGYAAVHAAGIPDSAESGADSDFAHAEGLIEIWGLDGGLSEWQSKAVQMMSEPRNVKAVAVVADWLARHRRLDADLVDVLVDYADGEVAAGELERYVALRAAIAQRRP
jgi:hypothetical protein